MSRNAVSILISKFINLFYLIPVSMNFHFWKFMLVRWSPYRMALTFSFPFFSLPGSFLVVKCVCATVHFQGMGGNDRERTKELGNIIVHLWILFFTNWCVTENRSCHLAGCTYNSLIQHRSVKYSYSKLCHNCLLVLLPLCVASYTALLTINVSVQNLASKICFHKR